MPQMEETKPVGDSVPKVDGAVAVGEDLEFQKHWWRFERVIWAVFILVLLADLSGLLGRGPLANAKRDTADGTLHLKYERVARANTSSIMTITPGEPALQNGKFQLFVSDVIVKQLGAQRVIPEPVSSTLGNGGVTYAFAAARLPMTVQIELKPSFVGMHHFTIGVPGGQPIEAKTFVLP